ncbi:biopolymer transporter ExbD [Betaproteobacteria bacterium PRO7]|jgi:biopolymer transport protein ExbD|nr:biopolymer transporter ExbD [Betaproteobacteria bacterium PRO7]GIL05225.1 MAG: transport-related membrane protein [Betaproteobacteria bacterium]
MSFGGFERGTSPSQPMAEINVTPLVDVMLVLLVIFIITAPLLSYAIKLDLPDARAPAANAASDAIKLSIDADGRVFWNSEPLGEGELAPRLAAAARQSPQPELHLRADKGTRYERIAAVMSAAQEAGLARIGFVTEPPEAAPTAGRTAPAPKK